MPSYRLRVEVGAMRAGANPQDVLPSAAAAAQRCCHLESRDIDVAGGAAWVQLRVTVEGSGEREEDDAARAALAAVLEAVSDLATTGRTYLLRRRPKGAWVPVETR